MLEYRAEGLCRNANHLSREELSRCMANGEVLQSTALAYDTDRRLRFELGGMRGIMRLCRRRARRDGQGHCRADPGGPPDLLCHHGNRV